MMVRVEGGVTVFNEAIVARSELSVINSSIDAEMAEVLGLISQVIPTHL
jgi:hypothetical protein